MSQGGVALEVGGLVKGFWQYLLARLQLRAELEKERERNRMYADHRDRLPENCELLDSEGCQGRVLWIRKGPQPGGGAFTQVPTAFVMAVKALPGTGAGRSRMTADGR
jgi:hypothetical protein